MVRLPQTPTTYSPLYFLAALGCGGLTVTFFLWLMFWVPHPGRPVPVFEDIAGALAAGSVPMQAMILVAWLGIAVFAVLKLRLLAWNLSMFAQWRQGPGYAAVRAGNQETQLLAAPLTLAMAVNVGFILGLVFVPGLWSVAEYLFPVAMVAFLAIGIWALRLLGAFFGRVLTLGGFDCAANNSFSQLLPSFALVMVGVGLAAPAAMSTTQWVGGLSYILSSFFVMVALGLGAIQLVLGLRAMMENGANAESAPSLWIVVPILTVAAIALMRQGHWMHGLTEGHGGAAATFGMLTNLVALQVGFALFGAVIMGRQRYFGRFVFGPERSAGSYALVCPGVALSVMTQFYVNKGLVGIGLIDKFSLVYWALTAIALLLQAATIWLVLVLNRKHFGAEPAALDRQTSPAGMVR